MVRCATPGSLEALAGTGRYRLPSRGRSSRWRDLREANWPRCLIERGFKRDRRPCPMPAWCQSAKVRPASATDRLRCTAGVSRNCGAAIDVGREDLLHSLDEGGKSATCRHSGEAASGTSKPWPSHLSPGLALVGAAGFGLDQAEARSNSGAWAMPARARVRHALLRAAQARPRARRARDLRVRADERPQRARAARLPAAQARTLALRCRKHNVKQLEELRQHLGDEDKLIALAKQGRRQLEELLAREREQARKRAHRIGWDEAEGDR